ncbi:MAG: hypothetical protein UU81_C0004G0020 [Microgenomates group bacterium GW2011_GWC1_41_8]|uniref:Uncharacterized protein n=2 Tax=Candidatus Roizmaniibacteriota TaxID=1752723 RepID=A0A0G0T4C1_9BACT|nr:MAG: hypothetical protein UT85_C0011G0019 [Candidatus Levybacteria bacterium GW2011_GWA2_40_16]KKR71854.1 MAG: hypothetical protein UU14_C0017G0019 [Candidatus Roizmanbacteria bacterium GW2011_GWB1_40_7]KKR92648.1 MAG: hypothetical protein UU41_C0026G0001 [Candidatus Roizmanbacteria bacterium GW2011_GWA1_41_13]KKS24623.1 MAG: hypothetical protein UU81_C0004G0020 [Microgenomates group bacterium GW2011_GWC1_41_8]OGK48136.1 MAG: hypothetical protein A3A55_02445 [Candidatus Roizmanbacteria bacte
MTNKQLISAVEEIVKEANETLRLEMKEGNEVLRSDMKDSQETLRSEMKEGFQSVNQKLRKIQKDMNGVIQFADTTSARLEKRVHKIESHLGFSHTID